MGAISFAIRRRAKSLPHYRLTTGFSPTTGKVESTRQDLPNIVATILPFHDRESGGVNRLGDQEGRRNEELYVMWSFDPVQNDDRVVLNTQTFEVKRFQQRENFWRAEVMLVRDE